MDETLQTETLKPCPFCGLAYIEMLTFAGRYFVVCHICRTHGPIWSSENRAAARWNSRQEQKMSVKEPLTRWIGVNEQLPEIGVPVLTWAFDWKVPYIDRLHHIAPGSRPCFWGEGTFEHEYGVEYWMPLPPPPEEKE